MESVMNFLADYYIWFFVAALILSFALIGFIIESKKKQKNEFKGEEVTEDIEIPSMPEDVTVVGNTIDMDGTTSVEEARKDLESTTYENPVVDNTPVVEEPINNNYEFFSNNVDMPSVTEAPVDYMNNVSYENIEPETLYEETLSSTNESNNEEEVTEEKVEEFNIFDDIK